MKRIHKLGLGVIAVLAFTAFLNATVASASPSGFLAKGAFPYPATFKLTPGETSGTSRLKIFGIEYQCEPPSFSATQSSPSTTLTTQQFDSTGSCNYGNATMDMHGCHFTFDPGAEASENFPGTLSIGPPGCGPITIEKLSGCTVSINPHSGFDATATFKNNSGVVEIFSNVTGLDYTTSGFACTMNGEASFNPSWKVKGQMVAGVSQPIEVVSELPFGLYMAGKESAKESEQPRFEAESYPLSISGGSPQTFTFLTNTTTCETSLQDKITKSAKQLTLDASHDSCTTIDGKGNKLDTTVSMKSCYYTLDLKNAGPPYSGLFGVGCTTGGDKIEYKAYGPGGSLLCTVTVGPQTGLSGVTLSGIGSGANRRVSLDAKIEGVQWERTGACGAGPGTGTISGKPTLTGVSQPPDTKITSGPSGTVSQPIPDVSFSFNATKSTSTLECSFDSAPYTPCTSPISYKGLAEGAHLFKTRAVYVPGNKDETPAERSFTLIDTPETTITSLMPSYTSGDKSPITFSSEESGVTYKCTFKNPEISATPCTSPYALPAGMGSGWHTFTVTATDKDGHVDPTPASYTFNLDIYPPAPSTSKLTSPEEGKKTVSYYTLKAQWGNPPSGGGVSGVTFQMKLDSFSWKEFRTIPAECVIDGQGKQVKWPLAATSNPGQTEPVFLKPSGCKPFAEKGYPEVNIKFRAVFDGGVNAAGASEPVTTEFLYVYGGTYGGVGAPTDATAQIGPTSLDLLTGHYTISRTDVSIPIPGSEASLEFNRTYESNYGAGHSNTSYVLGGMWQPSGPMEQAYPGEAWTELRERHENAVEAQYDDECIQEGFPKDECMVEEAIPAADWIELLDNEGGGAAFDISGSNYIAPEYMKEYVLTKPGEAFELASPEGTHTVFTKNSSISGSFVPKSISWQATSKSARMVYEFLQFKEGGSLFFVLGRMIAPGPSGVPCTDASSTKEAGCRTLTFQYSPCNCGGSMRLSSIDYYNASGNEALKQKVAEYEYDPQNRLIAEWDPRISPALKEKYSYDPGHIWRMTSLTPPGEEPWSFSYYQGGEFKAGEGGYSSTEDSEVMERLKSVSRATLTSPSTATTTIAYQVKRSGEGAPYDMSPATVAKWGQSDYPVDATAIFPPTQVPSSPRPTDFSRAMVHYMDPDGYEVNTASPQLPGASGPSISTSEIDSKGNVIRSLGAQNRLTALAATDTVARSKELDSHSTYNADGTEMLQSWGPLHKVRLESGETVEARTQTTIEYDKDFVQTPEEKAAGAPFPHLPTKERVGAQLPGQEGIYDQSVTETKYDWTLKAPIESIVDPGSEPEHLNLITKTVYYPKESQSPGLVKEVRQPSATSSGDGTTKTVYYTKEANTDQTACGNNAPWAGLPCVTYPAADPSPAESNPKLPWTWFTKYSNLDQPEEIQEKTNGVLKRTTTITYDSAGRVIKTKQTGVAGESTSVPAVEPTYSTTTGAVIAQRFKCESPESCSEFDTQEVKTTYDKLGRPTKYEDADGGKSETTYDLMGRVVLASDGKGTQTLTYDEKTGVATKLVDSAAGTFTASYNADGKMIQQLLPNGLAQQITYDEAGTAVSLRYQKESYCSSGCTWLQFSQEKSIRGQVTKQQSNLTSEEYAYDRAGRLTLAKQTPNLEGCTTRAYVYDKDSNRTSVTTRAPKEGACDMTSAGTKQSSTYDSADRLIGSGIVYDSLGRMTSLPSAYSGGGALTTSYYVNNQIKSQIQDGLTNTYELDSAGRQRKRTRSGSQSGTEVYHYASGSDMPVWIQEGANWTRNISALGGALGAVQSSTGSVTLQLADMHGDVVATADIDPTKTKLLSTQSFDEFGTPLKSGAAKFGWLGSKGRRTEFPSGIIQMGVRSYVPKMGRFISPDPVAGGSASAYDYSNADPVNQFDLSGEKPYENDYGAGCGVKLHVFSKKRTHGGKGRMYSRLRVNCMKSKAVVITIHKMHVTFEKARGGECLGKTFCKGPYCGMESDCEDVDVNLPEHSPRHYSLDESFVCDADTEYQMHVTLTVSLVTVAGVIATGKGKHKGSVAENQTKSFDLTAQEYCGHGKYAPG